MVLRCVVVTLAFAGTIGVAAQAPMPGPSTTEAASPSLTETDQLTLTVLQQQIEIAGQRLQLALTRLKRQGWHVEIVGGVWRYVADTPEPGAP